MDRITEFLWPWLLYILMYDIAQDHVGSKRGMWNCLKHSCSCLCVWGGGVGVSGATDGVIYRLVLDWPHSHDFSYFYSMWTGMIGPMEDQTLAAVARLRSDLCWASWTRKTIITFSIFSVQGALPRTGAVLTTPSPHKKPDMSHCSTYNFIFPAIYNIPQFFSRRVKCESNKSTFTTFRDPGHWLCGPMQEDSASIAPSQVVDVFVSRAIWIQQEHQN